MDWPQVDLFKNFTLWNVGARAVPVLWGQGFWSLKLHLRLELKFSSQIYIFPYSAVVKHRKDSISR